jgi:hypothetical protein
MPTTTPPTPTPTTTMPMQTLATADATADAHEWKQGQRAGIKVRFLKEPLLFNVDTSRSQCIKFSPTTFEEGGKRKVTLGITEEQAGLFQKLEKSLQKHADPAAVWTSPLKHTAFGHQISCKLPDTIQYYDHATNPATEPANWRGLECNACLRISTIWAQRNTQGFSVELAALQYAEGAVPVLANPFSG